MSFKYNRGRFFIKNKFSLSRTERLKYYFVLFCLTMESITIKVEEDLAKEIGKALKPYYSTKTEFIREAIRDKLMNLRNGHAMEELNNHFGKAKAKTNYNEEGEIREKVGRQFAKKFGIKL